MFRCKRSSFCLLKFSKTLITEASKNIFDYISTPPKPPLKDTGTVSRRDNQWEISVQAISHKTHFCLITAALLKSGSLMF